MRQSGPADDILGWVVGTQDRVDNLEMLVRDAPLVTADGHSYRPIKVFRTEKAAIDYAKECGPTNLGPVFVRPYQYSTPSPQRLPLWDVTTRKIWVWEQTS